VIQFDRNRKGERQGLYPCRSFVITPVINRSFRGCHMNILASIDNFRSWSLGEILIAIVLLAAAFALATIALRKFQVQIPDWLVQVLWIVAIAFVVVVAIRLVLSF
jgi:hypothetical protein